MREIKFRFWDPRNNIMVYGITEAKKLWDEHIDDLLNDSMQYTGLKDKNNREIYEGDILGHKKYGLLLVTFISGKFVCGDMDLGDIHEWTEVISNNYQKIEEPTPE